MKVFVQIPCLNEEGSLPAVLSSIPREISEDRMELPQQRPRFAFEERRRADRRGGREPEQVTAAEPEA